MSRQQWIVIGVIALVAVIAGFVLKSKSDAGSDSQSQLPAEQAEANYNVPPNIGMSVDNTGGANFPMGESGFTFTTSQANALPSNGNGS
jgi:hypothetical protein